MYRGVAVLHHAQGVAVVLAAEGAEGQGHHAQYGKLLEDDRQQIVIELPDIFPVEPQCAGNGVGLAEEFGSRPAVELDAQAPL